jgi:beta-N-acetylhexosaminidase
MALGDGSAPQPSAVSQLTPGQLAGQRVVAGLEGVHVPASLRRLIRDGGLAGVVLYADNFPSRAAGRRLIADLQAIRRPPGLRDPLLVLTDQEGGLVKRIDGAPAMSARGMASRGPAYSRRQGSLTARNLRDAGVNVNLAPVLDVARPGSALTETAREWGHTPAKVVAGAIPFAEAMQEGGVAAAAKHFPGLGTVRGNTDASLQRISLSRAALRGIDEVPFGRFAEAGGELVMLSAAVYPALSAKPAVFARAVATGELRGRLGFEGVAITDALDTASALSIGDPAEAGVAAARAGADLLLYTAVGPAAAAQRALALRLRAGALSRAAFEQSAGRVLVLRHRLAAD